VSRVDRFRFEKSLTCEYLSKPEGKKKSKKEELHPCVPDRSTALRNV